ncbi:MAG: MgtC/SapB family protein [Pyrinomonadaceae bacterium]
METIWNELTGGLTVSGDAVRVVFRLFASLILGAVVGLQREWSGKPAGLRTHILVSMGTTLVVVACLSIDIGNDGISRVIQGIVTGIGFIGAGAILKQSQKMEVHGLTTAAGVWLTAAAGVAIGLGRTGIAFIGIAAGIAVLSLLGRFEVRMGWADPPKEEKHPSAGT